KNTYFSNKYMTGIYHLQNIYWHYDSSTVQTVPSPVDGTANWKVKKAFLLKDTFFVLTPEMVYYFSKNVLQNTNLPDNLHKVSYGDFFFCKEKTENTKVVTKGKPVNSSSHVSTQRDEEKK